MNSPHLLLPAEDLYNIKTVKISNTTWYAYTGKYVEMKLKVCLRGKKSNRDIDAPEVLP